MPRRGVGPVVLALAPALVLAACAASTLPYTPAQQPAGTLISADYQLLADRLLVEIDSGGYRLEDAQILTAGGSAVRPETIEHPAPRGGSGLGLGVGVGGGRYGGSGIGVGVGVGTTVGGSRAAGNTLAYFALDRVGPPPWRLRVKVVGVDATEIVLDPGRR